MPMKKTIMILLLTALCLVPFTGQVRAAAADFYEELEVRLEVRGTGSFTMEEVNRPQNMQTITANGQGFFVWKFTEPGNYRYRIFSSQPDQTERYTADICVYQSTRAENELYAVVTVTSEADSRKLDHSVIEYTRTPSPDQTGSSGSDGRAGSGQAVRTGDNGQTACSAAGLGISALLIIVIHYTNLRKRKNV